MGAGGSIGLWQTPDGTWGFYHSSMQAAGFNDEGANVGPEISFTNHVDPDGGSDVGTCVGWLAMVCFSHSKSDISSFTTTVTEGTGIFNFTSSTSYTKLGTGMSDNRFDSVCGLIFAAATPAE